LAKADRPEQPDRHRVEPVSIRVARYGPRERDVGIGSVALCGEQGTGHQSTECGFHDAGKVIQNAEFRMQIRKGRMQIKNMNRKHGRGTDRQ
jgi:hypothetical protein